MSISIVGGAAVVDDASGTSASVTTPSVAVDDVLVAFGMDSFYTLAEMKKPSQPSGVGTWTEIDTADLGNNNAKLRAWWAPITGAGAKTITLAPGHGDEEVHLHVYPLNGADPSAPIDGHDNALNTVATGSHASPSVSPAGADDLLLSAICTGGGSTATLTAQGSMTPDTQTDNGGSTRTAYETLSASGATGTRTWTTASGRTSALLTVAIKAATGGGTADATLAATLPELTGAIEATASPDAVLAATLPALTATIAADASAGATLAGTLPELTGSLAAGASGVAALAGTLPALTADIRAFAGTTALYVRHGGVLVASGLSGVVRVGGVAVAFG